MPKSRTHSTPGLRHFSLKRLEYTLGRYQYMLSQCQRDSLSANSFRYIIDELRDERIRRQRARGTINIDQQVGPLYSGDSEGW
jgi:hypothetical protein